LLQSAEELRSAVERAQAFERRHDPQLRVGVYDQYLTVLADIMIVRPKDIDEEIDVSPPAAPALTGS
jgi:Mg2+/Co2+ transporter CorB